MTPVEPTARTPHRMKPQRSIRLIRYTINQIALLFKIQMALSFNLKFKLKMKHSYHLMALHKYEDHHTRRGIRKSEVKRSERERKKLRAKQIVTRKKKRSLENSRAYANGDEQVKGSKPKLYFVFEGSKPITISIKYLFIFLKLSFVVYFVLH